MRGTAACRRRRSWRAGSSSERAWHHMAEVLVLAEHSGGEVKKVTAELLTAARRLGEPSVVWAGPGAAEGRARLAEIGAVTVYVAASPEFARFVVAPKAEGKEVAGRLAVKTKSGVLTDAVAVRAGPDGRVAEQANFGGAVTV